MSQSMQESPNEAQIKQLFTKAYGQPGPTPDQWKAVYADNVHFIDPTQERKGIDAYILAQNNLLQRCDDVFLEPHSIAFNKDVAFIEWTMGLKIQGIEFIYPGATRMTFGTDRKIIEH
ncbi:nuclear transport factor 2 family protein, partial [Synechococcus sp. AH-551-A10]